MLYFYSNSDPKTLYYIPKETAILSDFFNNSINQSYDKNADGISLITLPKESKYPYNRTYNLNDNMILPFIAKYFDMWKENISENYKPNTTIFTSNVNNVLHPKDVEFINSYISYRKPDILINMEHITHDEIFNLKLNNEILTELLNQSEYLEIESLSNKIYIYIACNIWKLKEYSFENIDITK